MADPRDRSARSANMNQPAWKTYLWWIIGAVIALVILFVFIVPLFTDNTAVDEPFAEEPGVEVGPETEAEPAE